MSTTSYYHRELRAVLTPHHVARNVDDTCLIIYDNISKNFGHMPRRHKDVGRDPHMCEYLDGWDMSEISLASKGV